MSKTADAIKRLQESLVVTTNALKAVSDVLEETEPFYFELFRQREQQGAAIDQQYVKKWKAEFELKKLDDNSDTVEMELCKVQQAMTDVMNKL